MKIAVPVNENNSNSDVCPSFGRTPYYMIYDTETKTHEFLLNEAANSAGGAGIKAAQTLVDKNVKVIIAPRYGENAAKIILDAGISVYKNIDASAQENIEAYESDKLNFLKDIHPGYHRHGN